MPRKERCAGRPGCHTGEGRYDWKEERCSTASRCAGVVPAASTQGKRTQHGKPQGVVGDDQPDAGDGRAGPQRPAGGDRGGRDAVPRPSGGRGRRPRGLARQRSPRRTDAVAGAAHRRSTSAASDLDVAGMRRGRNRRPRTEYTYDRGQGQRARHPAALTHLTLAGESVHAPACVRLEEARAGQESWYSHRDLRRRSRDSVQEGPG
jgi:hypothetical protein